MAEESSVVDAKADQRERSIRRSLDNFTPPAKIYREGSPSYQRILVTTDGIETNPEHTTVVESIEKALLIRNEYVFSPLCFTSTTNYKDDPNYYSSPSPHDSPSLSTPAHSFRTTADSPSVYSIFDSHSATPLFTIHKSLRSYYQDHNFLMDFINWGPSKTLCYQRLKLLEGRFNMHLLLNESKESDSQKLVPHRDFYNVRKCDTHIHHSSSMTQKQLLKFIKRKLRTCPDEVVIHRDGKNLTLKEVFESLSLSTYNLSANTLNVHAHKETFHRFDKFNLKYNPFGQPRLREIFLKTDNFIKGRYLAEMTRELIDGLEESKYQLAEWRISIYGKSRSEWSKLAAWVIDNNLLSSNIRWIIQIPRLYSLFKEQNQVKNFNEVISNIFEPLFEVSINPSSNPKLHQFLHSVVAFDTVDDESKNEPSYREYETFLTYNKNGGWDLTIDPPYSYWLYHIWANLTVLNKYRQSKNLKVFYFRPHSGEAGETEHLAAAFMVANNICHGIQLTQTVTLQYLYYLAQIGLALSPLSNNSLFVKYQTNPFPKFFARGLNVSLSTDDPLQFHVTREPLIEEYSVAGQVWKFSTTDMCEIARNSLYQSGFETEVKENWLGKNFREAGVGGNDINHTGVTGIRISYRQETLLEEFGWMVMVLKREEKEVKVFEEMVKKLRGE
eukprot:TRINITY_DN6534_c0_g1_i1.p1 TRINITY_DN6534_c0_g1~~TRINITY_DN6534_c0_g1_i1.p1  ORF type:complete len:670 (+),score=137.97 TRINITY_DN6534_c0_g1_i1:88-2097(+)